MVEVRIAGGKAIEGLCLGSPVPLSLVDRLGVRDELGDFHSRHGLGWWWLADTTWTKRCKNDISLPWRFWSGVRALELDGPDLLGSGAVDLQAGAVEADAPQHLGSVAGVRLVKSDDPPTGAYGVQLDARGRSRVLAPGPTLEQLALADDMTLVEVMQLELGWAKRWLEADECLGLVALLGPLTRRTYDGLRRRRESGYVDAAWSLTNAGWWKLCYEAGQGQGGVERARQRLLRRMHAMPGAEERGADDPDVTPVPISRRRLRRKHLLAVQATVLRLYQERGLVPLGVERCAVGEEAFRFMRCRSDALMSSPDGGRLVWIEVLRWDERHLSKERQARYVRMRRDLPVLAAALGRPVELVLVTRGGEQRVLYSPQDAAVPILASTPEARASAWAEFGDIDGDSEVELEPSGQATWRFEPDYHAEGSR